MPSSIARFACQQVKCLRSTTASLEQALTASTLQGQIRTMATKKQGGSSNNGRDSIGRRLGIKLEHGKFAKAGSIVIRQRGLKYRAGDNVGTGKDHTLFATKPGVVQFQRIPNMRQKRHVVSVVEA